MTRAELAEAVCAWLWHENGIQVALAHYIAKFERGAVGPTGRLYRDGLRAVVGVATDRELGMEQQDRPAPTARHPRGSAAELNPSITVICDTRSGSTVCVLLRASDFREARR